MYRIVRQLILLFAICTLAACQSGAVTNVEQPEWITDPQDGAVGSAVTHVLGRHAQEELAITRARERLAARFGVQLSSVQTIQQRVVNERAYVTSNKQIEQAVSKREVKAHVRAIWYDQRRDVVWAWVYPVN